MEKWQTGTIYSKDTEPQFKFVITGWSNDGVIKTKNNDRQLDGAVIQYEVRGIKQYGPQKE